MPTLNELDERITNLALSLDMVQEQVSALQNTHEQSSETTSGQVVNISNGESVATLDTSRNNPAIKMFNASTYNYTYVSVSNGEAISGGIDNGRTEVIHHSTVGEVVITFFHDGIITDDNQYIVVESAGG